MEDHKNRIMKAPHRTRQALFFSLVGILPMLVLCGVSHAATINPFDFFFNKLATIKVEKGKTVTVDREFAKLTFPVKFTISGQFPVGDVDCFAMVVYKEKLLALSQPATKNPFGKPIEWKPDFFPWYQGDRLVPYKTISGVKDKIVFDGYASLLKEHFTSNKISQLLFAVAGKGKAQSGKFDKAYIVVVNLK